MKLKIGDDFSLPLKFLSLRKVVFGGSGSGKTASGRTLFEEATEAGVLCGAIDLKGDWWGLKASADGKDEGIPIVIFGGDHQDVPLDENGGVSLAEIVVELRQPFVIDLENISRGKQHRFLAAFFDRLYDKNREPLVLFCDEADRYAPQKPMTPEANFCLAAAEDIAKRGRKHGIFPVFISQRNASLNKGVTELCDVAIVFRTPGPRDQEAVEDWFSTKATREQRDEVMGKLASMETGTAIMCSAHPDVKLFATVPVRLPHTFDSSATPEIGKRRIEPKRLAKPDLVKIEQRMAATIEKAKAEDPRELRRELAAVRAELSKVRANMPEPIQPKEKRVEIPILKDAQIKRLEQVAAKVEAAAAKYSEWWRTAGDLMMDQVKTLAGAAAEIAGAVRAKPAPAPYVSPRTELIRQQQRAGTGKVTAVMVSRGTVDGPGDPALTGGLRRMMIALAQRMPLNRGQLGIRAGVSPKGGSFDTYLSRARTAGWIDGRGEFVITPEGLKALGHYEPLPEGSALLAYWLNRFGGGVRRMLEVLAEAYPKTLDRGELGERAGISPAGGSFDTYMSRLRTLELIEGRGEFKASAELFD